MGFVPFRFRRGRRLASLDDLHAEPLNDKNTHPRNEKEND